MTFLIVSRKCERKKVNSATGGISFTVGWDFAKIIEIKKLNRMPVAQVFAIAISMAHGARGCGNAEQIHFRCA
jgi:hypothetical protein